MLECRVLQIVLKHISRTMCAMLSEHYLYNAKKLPFYVIG